MMLTALTLCLVLTQERIDPAMFPHGKIATVRGRSPAGEYSVRIEIDRFDATGRALTWTETPEGRRLTIDGRAPWGVPSGQTPTTQISRLTASAAHRDWRVDPLLYRDCFQPGINVEDEGRQFWAWFSDDGTRVTIKMNGGALDARYNVIWTLTSGGGAERAFYVPGQAEPKRRERLQAGTLIPF